MNLAAGEIIVAGEDHVNTILDITSLDIVKMIPLKDGKLIVRSLPSYPILECSREDCDEMADYLAYLVHNSGSDSCYSFCCLEHKNGLISVSLAEKSIY